MTPKTTSPARGAAIMLLLCLVFAYIFSCTILLCGFQISGALFPLALVTAISLAAVTMRRRTLLRALGLFSAALALSFCFGHFIVDFSGDGIVTHQEIISLLADGWNPFRISELNHDSGFILWAYHYAKALEIAAATIVKTFATIQIGKAVNFMLAFSCTLFVFDALHSRFTHWSLRKSAVITLCIVASPIVTCQIYIYYIDFALYLYLLLTLLFIRDICTGTHLKSSSLLLLAVTILAIGTKFNACFFQGLTLILAIAWLVCSKQNKSARRIFLISCAALVAGLIFAYHPYVTNFITHGHPLFPLMGEGKNDIMTPNTPAIFGRGRVIDFFRSITAINWPTYDQRIGGYGPFMTIIILLSAAIIIKQRARLAPAMIFTAICAFLSCFIFEQSWWARYIPQLWIVPSIALIAGFGAPGRKRMARVLAALMLLTIPVSMVQGARAVRATWLYDAALYSVLRNDTVRIVNCHSQHVRMFREHDVVPLPLDSLPIRIDGDIICMTGPHTTVENNDSYPMFVLTRRQCLAFRQAAIKHKVNYDYYRYKCYPRQSPDAQSPGMK